MKDYKDTLNLPKTDFAMRANLSQKEPLLLKKWQQDNLYQKIQQNNKTKEKFILHDGPPYANGDIHLGHAVNKILKDIIIKSKNLSGFNAPFIPGWDCHGLPIELNVEKKKGKVGKKIDSKTFRKECRKYAEKQVNKQKEDFKRLGILADWDNPYLTKNYKFEADTVRALGKIIDNGHLTNGYKPVHWCCDCASSLAEAEVEYKNKQSDAIDVAFRIIDNNILPANTFAIIWTTTPWTLPANEAIALNPDLEYSLITKNNKYYLVATKLSITLCEKYNAKTTKFNFKGNELENITVKHPFYDKDVAIVFADYVSADNGTGLVHIAPAHGQEDYQVGIEYNLALNCLVGNNGVFLENTKFFANEFIFKANNSVIDKLKENGALMFNEKIEHSYPHCWRHKSPIIFRATPQWFIAMNKNNLQNKVLNEINNIKWMPDWGKKRIEIMVEGRPDWCISRQRFWGAPIALFVHKQTGDLHPKTISLIAKIANEIEKYGIDIWFDNDNNYFNVDDQYEKITDTLDVWFDSGISHFAVLNNRKELSFPADLYLEGSDQHRGWFQSSILTSVAINGVAPYKQVLTHGFTVDTHGKKMSKSLKNTTSPQKITNSLGADVLRLWVASSNYTMEMSVSDEIFKGSSDSYRHLRNTIRFILANMHGFDNKKDIVDFSKMLDLDKWIVSKMAALEKLVIKQYNNYNFHIVVQDIINFTTNDLSSFYLDIIKDRQYTTKKDSLARKSAQSALYYLSNCLVKLLSPILSFTCEEAWGVMGNKNSIFLEKWQNLNLNFDASAIETARELNSKIKQNIESMRKNGLVGSSLDCELDIYCNDKIYNNLASFADELRFIFITSVVRIHKSEKLKIMTKVSDNKKCIRCWHKRLEVGNNNKHPELCARCIENIDGNGEIRKYC